MSSDEDVPMGDGEGFPTLDFKGKGKAVENDHTRDENLPW